MRAIVCEAFGGPEGLVWREVADPAPPGPEEIRLRILARGVQYVDVLMLAGQYQFRPLPPFIPGSEAAGEVISIGAGVEGFKPGDKVMARLRLGAFGEIANARAEDCDLLPAALGLEEGAVLRAVYMTAYHALLDRGRLKKGESVLIHGAAGGIGLAAVHLAKLFGARVIATASSEEKRAIVLAEGADEAIAYAGGFRERVLELSGGRGVDIVYDPIGGAVSEESLRSLAWGGRLLILGFLGGGPAQIRSNYLLIKGIEAVGVRMGGFYENEPEHAAANAKALLSLAAEGKIKPRISFSVPLARAAEAFAALIERRVTGKAVVVG